MSKPQDARGPLKEDRARDAAATRPTVEPTAELARLDRAQAAILRGWAADLQAAAAAKDWVGVADVRNGLAVAADVLDEGAGDARALAERLERLKGGA